METPPVGLARRSAWWKRCTAVWTGPESGWPWAVSGLMKTKAVFAEDDERDWDLGSAEE